MSLSSCFKDACIHFFNPLVGEPVNQEHSAALCYSRRHIKRTMTGNLTRQKYAHPRHPRLNDQHWFNDRLANSPFQQSAGQTIPHLQSLKFCALHTTLLIRAPKCKRCPKEQRFPPQRTTCLRVSRERRTSVMGENTERICISHHSRDHDV